MNRRAVIADRDGKFLYHHLLFALDFIKLYPARCRPKGPIRLTHRLQSHLIGSIRRRVNGNFG